MSSIEIRGVETLCYAEIKKLIPATSHHLLLKNAQAGLQPKDTVVIGNLKSHSQGKCSNNIPSMNCIFEEVVSEGDCSRSFEAIFYADCVSLMKQCWDKIGAAPAWVLFASAHLVPNAEADRLCCPLTIEVRPKADFKVVLAVANNQRTVDYTTLCDVSAGTRHCVFGVVKEVVKPTPRHTVVALVDPSCRGGRVLEMDVLFTDAQDEFSEPIEAGDILRINDMLGEFDDVDQKMRGRINVSQSITKYHVCSEDNAVSSATSLVNYELTEQDINEVLLLWRWKEEVGVASNPQPRPSPELRLEDGTAPRALTCSCSVHDVINGEESVVLKVFDVKGFEGASSEGLLGGKRCEESYPAGEFNVVVSEPLLRQKAAKLQRGDLALLVNVSPRKSPPEDGAPSSRLEWRVEDPGGDVRKLADEEVQLVAERLNGGQDQSMGVWRSQAECPNSKAALDPSVSPFLNRSSDDKESRSVKQKCSLGRERSDSKRQRNHLWLTKKLITECSFSCPRTSVTQLLRASGDSDHRRVWVLLKSIHTLLETSSRECECGPCFHDWTWGTCPDCGFSSSSSGLRDLYPRSDLLKKASLPCPSPSCRDRGGRGALMPFFWVVLELEGLTDQKIIMVDLAGEAAELFFGVSPSFKWALSSPDPDFQEKMFVLHETSHLVPMEVCLSRVPGASSGYRAQICCTTTRFI